jgi:uncharacterized protein
LPVSDQGSQGYSRFLCEFELRSLLDTSNLCRLVCVDMLSPDFSAASVSEPAPHSLDASGTDQSGGGPTQTFTTPKAYDDDEMGEGEFLAGARNQQTRFDDRGYGGKPSMPSEWSNKSKKLAMEAAARGNTAVLGHLLNSHGGANFKQRVDGMTPLMIASKCKQVEAVKLLLAQGGASNVDVVNQNGSTALLFAADAGSAEVCQLLIMAGSRPDHHNIHQRTALLQAIYRNHIGTCRALLDIIPRYSSGINKVNGDGTESPLLLAALCNFHEIAQLLIDYGASVDIRNKHGSTPLMVASSENHFETTMLLLQRGANVDVTNKYEYSPLLIAAERGHDRVVSALLAKKCRVNAQTSTGNTALHVAALNGFEDIVRQLLRAGALIEPKAKNGNNALMSSVQGGHVSVVSDLLKADASVNAYHATTGHTPLHLACEGGNGDLVGILVSKGAKVDSIMKNGASVIDLLLLRIHEEGMNPSGDRQKLDGYLNCLRHVLKGGAPIASIKMDICDLFRYDSNRSPHKQRYVAALNYQRRKHFLAFVNRMFHTRANQLHSMQVLLVRPKVSSVYSHPVVPSGCCLPWFASWSLGFRYALADRSSCDTAEKEVDDDHSLMNSKAYHPIHMIAVFSDINCCRLIASFI